MKSYPQYLLPNSGDVAKVFHCAKCAARIYNVVFFPASDGGFFALCFSDTDRFGLFQIARADQGDERATPLLLDDWLQPG